MAAASDAPVPPLAFAPGEQQVLVGSQAGLAVYTWLELELELTTKLRHIHDLSFAPTGDFFAAADGRPGQKGTVEVFHWPGGELVYRVSPHADLVYGVAWSPDAKFWTSASYDRAVEVRDSRNGQRVREIRGHSHPVLAACYTSDGGLLITAGADQSLRVWNAQRGGKVRVLENHTGAVLDLAARPRSPSEELPMVASVSEDRTLRFWQPTVGRLVRFARLEAKPLAVVWTADGKYAAIACNDGHVRVVDPETADVVADLPAVDGWAHALAASAKDEFLVGGARGQLTRIRLKGRSKRNL